MSFLVLLTGTIFSKTLWGLGIGLICVLIIYFLAKLPIKSTLRIILKAIPFILILIVLQVAFSRPVETDKIIWEWAGIRITNIVLWHAIILFSRFIVLIFLINAFVMSLSTSQITSALFYLLKPLEKIRFPVNDLTMVVQITLRYIPMVAQRAEKIAKAQASRGADWDQHGFNPIKQAKRVFPLIIPIIINSLKQAEVMAVAMESRGFNAAEKRSSYYELDFNWLDGLLIISAILLSIAMLLMGILG
jgi:energy-coupling factor transport system permease protein